MRGAADGIQRGQGNRRMGMVGQPWQPPYSGDLATLWQLAGNSYSGLI